MIKFLARKYYEKVPKFTQEKNNVCVCIRETERERD